MSSTQSAFDDTPSGFVDATVGKHYRRCENAENDTCGTECYMITLGNKILATTPGVTTLDEMVARFIVTAFNAQRAVVKITEGHYEHE